jgi:adenine-specific DNA methylase
MVHRTSSRTTSVLGLFDAAAMRDDVAAETRSRQRHLPPISVYRWWARRAETVTGAIVDAVAAERPGESLLIADTFAGGGVIALSALMRGHRVYAQDVNPWAARGLATMLSLPTPEELESASSRLHSLVQPLLERSYGTKLSDGTPGELSNTLRVAVGDCPCCGSELRLFPTSLVSLTERVDCGGVDGFTACPAGHMNRGPASKRHACEDCGRYIKVGARYTSNREARCYECRWQGKLALLAQSGLRWEVVLVERLGAGRREIAEPTPAERSRVDSPAWKPQRALPRIAEGAETRALLRHGFAFWHDLYPARQRVVTEHLLAACEPASAGDAKVRDALEVAVIGSTEMAGYASRWDPRYLKAYEAIANHRFNFTTLSAEPHVWGARGAGRGTVFRRIAMMSKASSWLQEQMGRQLSVIGPRPASDPRTRIAKSTDAVIATGSSERLLPTAGSLDAVITDPPYHDDVQYGELSDLFRAWDGGDTGALQGDAIVRRYDATASSNEYASVLTAVFTEIRRALKSDGHLVLSYANRNPVAWVALFDSLQASGFVVVGYTVVHSENETDHAKAGRRACTSDVLLDALPAAAAGLDRYSPTDSAPRSDEEAFCHRVGAWALRVGGLAPGWETQFGLELAQEAFLT